MRIYRGIRHNGAQRIVHRSMNPSSLLRVQHDRQQREEKKNDERKTG